MDLATNYKPPALTDDEFELFRQLIYDVAGISLSTAKKALVAARLLKRVKYFGMASYRDYFVLLKTPGNDELQNAVDMLTTNETFFFREKKHFEFLQHQVLPHWRSGDKRIWSAASSSGEEAYSLAMTLSEYAPTDTWEVVGTDISTRVLKTARKAQYPMSRSQDIPLNYLKKYCLKGIGTQEGTFLIQPALSRKVSFLHANLKQNLTRLGRFDVIFLRNVMIYFNNDTKRQVLALLLQQLNPGGFLMIGHSESLNGITNAVQLVSPSIYVKAR
ncbi:CheR family methyltransferase [Gynuella sunshinyii]|uniref:Chemotaxis protein methyltransferase n=1 Tax=Gynuella sunshinyii YC6258 TaxID=1445510 RepID=A0A0C5W390_9GAMM|nr:protein-glutamate O-methyltransferase CheR [Gynuella sunshinyii]AJQ97114.1 methylase of chemotaxis methyl-accepting protein [Gynuella sunshinyii YC6258]